MLDAHLGVNQTGLHETLVIGNGLQLDRKCSRGIRKSRPGLVTMKDLFLWIEILEAWNQP